MSTRNSRMRILPVLLLAWSAPISAQAQTTLSIDSCKAEARRNYPLIRQYDLIAQSEAYTIRNARTAYLPQLSLTGIGAYVFGGFPSFGPPESGAKEENFKFIGIGQVNQALWDGGATASRKDIARSESAVESAQIDVQLYALRERIEQICFGILLLDEQIAQLRVQSGSLGRNVERLRLLTSNGLALKTSLSEMQAEALQVEQRITEQTFARTGYVYMLSLLLGRPLPDSVHIELPPIDPSISSGEQVNRPELSLYARQRELIDASASVDQVRLMPKVGLLGAGLLITPGMQLGGEEKTSLALAGLSVSWDIGGLYTNSNDRHLHEIRTKQSALQEETFRFNTAVQSVQANTEAAKYEALMKSDEQILTLRHTIREGYQIQYDAGSCPAKDLIDATDKETEAALNKAMHHVQWIYAIYRQKTILGN